MGWINITGVAIFATIFAIIIANDRDLYSEQEMAAINKLRPQVEHLFTLPHQQQDGYILKFIRNEKFDIQKAKGAVERAAQWRREYNIDSILDEDLSSHYKYFPAKVEGVDRSGRPIILLPFGKYKLRKYVVAGKLYDANRVFRQHLERVQRKIFENAEATGSDVDGFYAIIDCTGISVREHLCRGCIPLTLDMATSFDLGSGNFIKNLTAVNTPRIFQPVVKLIRQVFNFHSLTAFNDYTSDKGIWLPKLHADIVPDQLPKSLGGTRKD